MKKKLFHAKQFQTNWILLFAKGILKYTQTRKGACIKKDIVEQNGDNA